MIKIVLLIYSILLVISVEAQQMDSDLQLIQQRLEAVRSYEAEVTFEVDIDFINMPTKTAYMVYRKGEKLGFDSNDFVLIPKKGLDFSLSQLLNHPILTVDRGNETFKGVNYKVINVIPTTDKSDFSIAKLYLDLINNRIGAAEISTKKEGMFWIEFNFNKPSQILPNKVTVQFEVERFRLPINFMGKDTDIDRKKMRSDEPKRGSIYLDINYTKVEM